MRVTIHDVAKSAGVSITTVSHVLNGGAHRDRYAATTVQGVLRASERLGYVPSRRGRSMSTGLNRVVSIFAELNRMQGSPYSCMVFTGAAMALRESGYTVEIVDPRLETNLGSVLANTDGVLFCVNTNLAAETTVAGSGLPMVRLNQGKFEPLNVVEPDDPGGMAAMGAHLLAMGYQRVLYVRPLRGHSSIRIREHALKASLAGLDFAAVDFEEEKLRAIIQDLKRDRTRRTVLVAYGDGLRLVVQQMLFSAGLSIPQDVGLASSHTGMLDPLIDRHLKVTGVTYSVMELGAIGARMLLERIRNAGADMPSVVVPELFVPGVSTCMQ